MNRKKRSWWPWIILLALIGWLLGRSYFLTKTPINLAPLSSQIEQQINQILVQFDFADSDIISQYRLEKNQGRIYWVEVHREIRLPSKINFPNLRKKIIDHLAPLNIEIIADRWEDERYILSLGKKGYILHQIIFKKTEKVKTAKTAAIAIIIDDVGGSLEDADKFLELGLPITYAILPFEPYSRTIAEKIHQQGDEIILHLPLEPERYPVENPGKAALFVSMTTDQIAEKLDKNIRNVPYLSGINNHMGSRFTQNSAQMERLLSLIKEKNLFFVDSFTSPHSVAKKVGQKLGMNILRNDVFLDNQDTFSAIIAQLKKLEKKAFSQGQAIAIGHVHKKFTAPAIKQIIATFRKDGINFVFVSQLEREKNKLVRAKPGTIGMPTDFR